jgi:hypothetical protein
VEGSVLLADYAQVNGGKLYVIGAGITFVGTPNAAPPHPIEVYAAVLLSVPWHAHNQAHRLKIALLDPDGGVVPIAQSPPGVTVASEDEGSVVAQFNAGRGPTMQVGDDSLLPLAVPLKISVPGLGSYSVVLEVDGIKIAEARFRVVHMQQFVVQSST